MIERCSWRHEKRAIYEVESKYITGIDGLTVGPCGFLVCEQYPFLGATPDGTVYDPTNLEQPFGFLEVKCPYSQGSYSC